MGAGRVILLDLAVVIAGAVADIKLALGALLRLGGELHGDAAEIVAHAAGRVVGKQILGAQLVADLAEGLVKLRQRGGVIVLAPGIARELDEGMFARPCRVRRRPRWAP